MVTRPDTEWEAWFAGERAHLLDALGWLADGGLVEQIAPLGAGGLPGAPDDAPLSLGVSTWPFPPAPGTIDALHALGYAPVAGAETATTCHFARAIDNVHLLLAEAGCDAWGEALLLREYGAAVESARPRLAAAHEGAAARALLDEAARWWIEATGFAPLHAIAAEMDGCACDWAVGSGWAIDLFLGRVTRVHHDVDLIVDRRDQFVLREHLAARGYRFVTPLAGRLEPWPPHMRIELPRHQVHAHRENDFIDILLTDFDGGFWRYRRDPTVARAVERALRQHADGPRYLAPELVLLFKSKNTGRHDRPKDQQDFDAVAAQLDAEARAWLRWALVATDPEHAWLQSL